jgi:hypothetical protein
VGTEGGWAVGRVPGVGGTWRDLTDSVNFKGNLTTRYGRSLVATAVRG